MAEAKKETSRDQGLEKPVFGWSAAEFSQYKKKTNWYLIIGFSAVILIIIFVWMKNYTAAGVVFAAGLALSAQANVKPKKIKCEIYPSGVVVGEKAYPFDSLKSFWVIFGESRMVRLQPQGRLSASINMPISKNEDPEQIRLFLAKHLPEDEDRGEDIADTIQRWFKF